MDDNGRGHYEQKTSHTRNHHHCSARRPGGYRLSASFAAELEAGFTYNPVKQSGPVAFIDWDIYQVPLLANIVYTLPLEGRIKPYVGLA